MDVKTLILTLAIGLGLSPIGSGAYVFDFVLGFLRDLLASGFQVPVSSANSESLPKWSFDVAVTRSPLYQPSMLDVINGSYRTELIEVAARRQLFEDSNHWLFASIGASPTFAVYSPDWVALNRGRTQAAALGWQLQSDMRFSFAVEYEFRKIGDNNDNALQIGVHYLF